MATPYKWRPALCQYLREQGFKVQDGLGNVAAYALGYNMAICTAESSDGQEFIKWRVFEAMAMGCTVLHTENKLMDRLFNRGEHYFWVQPEEDGNGPMRKVVDWRIRQIKENPSVYSVVANAARKLVLREHTYRNRAETILKDVGLT